jgi:hypothetical protein
MPALTLAAALLLAAAPSPPTEELTATPITTPIEEPADSAGETTEEQSVQRLLKYGAKSERAYRGSRTSLRTAFSAVSLAPSAELTYNPQVVTRLRLLPRWWFNDQIYARAMFDVSAELTQADWTDDHVYVGDLRLTGGWADIVRIPVVDVDISAEATIVAPTSAAARAQSLILETAIDVNFARTFAVLGGLSVQYEAGIANDFHRYTTASDGGCLAGGFDDNCAVQIGSGHRNVSWWMSHTLIGSLLATDWLATTAVLGVTRGQLYGLEDEVTSDERISLESPEPTNARYYLLSQLAVTFFPRSMVTGTVGAFTYYGQLEPNGTYETPLFNRNTQIYAEVGLSIDQALDSL